MSSSSKKTVLMISYWFAPMHGMGVKRVLGFYRYFKKKGFNINVLTTSNRKFVKQDVYSYTEEDVEEVYTVDFRTLSSTLKINQNNKKAELKKKRKVYQVFTKLSQSFPFYFIFGEGSIIYLINAFRLAKRNIRNLNIEIIFSSYSPIGDHLVSYLLKRKFPQIIWIADFRDQHVDLYRKNTFFPNFQKRIDRYLLSRADIITTASKGLANNIRVKKNKSFVIYNDIATKGLNWNKKYLKPNKFLIVYTGTLYPWQSADLFFKCIANLIKQNRIQESHIRLLYNGQNKSIWNNWMRKHKLESYSNCTDIVPQKESFKNQQIASINLVLTWSDVHSRGVMTGKLFEYLEHPNPIWIFVNGEIENELSEFLSQEHHDKVFSNQSVSSEEIEKAFLEAYHYWLITPQADYKQRAMNKTRTEESLNQMLAPLISEDEKGIHRQQVL